MIVADAGPLIAFARIGRLDLLRDVLGEILVPSAVYEELVLKGRGRPGAQEIAQSSWISRHIVEDSPALSSPFSTRLHQGEAEAISLARQLRSQLLIDEHQGRVAAQDLGIEVIGSLAVLAEARRRGLVESVRPILGAMTSSGYWIDADLVMTFLAELGEAGDARQ